MCVKRYCVGCGNVRVLVLAIYLCTDCYRDWLRLAPKEANA